MTRTPTLETPETPNQTITTEQSLGFESLKDSFKSRLLNHSNSLNKFYNHNNGKVAIEIEDPGYSIEPNNDDRERIYQPWQYVVIVKLFVKRITHNYLKTKLVELWKSKEPLTLIDLGCNFYIEKFSKPDNMLKALHGGPWFLTYSFLSVKHWEPNFVLEEATKTLTAIWIRLPQLRIEFYDRGILERLVIN